MKVHQVNAASAVILVVMSGWAYFGSDTPSITALIPGVFGLLLLACTPGVKAHNKIVAHVAVVLALLVFAALFKPLSGALSRGDTFAIVRTGIMSLAALAALVAFVFSFIAARRARKMGETV